MSVFAHSSHGHRDRRTKYRERDAVASKRHGEACSDILLACRVWLFKNVPGYREECEQNGNRNGSKAGR